MFIQGSMHFAVFEIASRTTNPSSIKVTHIEVIESVGWMCKHTAAWANVHSPFDEVVS